MEVLKRSIRLSSVHTLQGTYLELSLRRPGDNDHPHFSIWCFSWSDL